jgi:hypothetical protein
LLIPPLITELALASTTLPWAGNHFISTNALQDFV